MLSDEENDPQRKPQHVEKKRKTRQKSKRPPSPRKPLTRRQRVSSWAMRPIKRGAEKAVEHAAVKFFGALLFWLGLFCAMAFAHYVDVLPLPGGWKTEIKLSPPVTTRYPKAE